MKIYYESSSGKIIDLKGKTYRLQTGSFFDYEWNYESTTYTNRNGGSIDKFTRGITKEDIKIAVTARSKELYYEALNELFETIEADVRKLKPGKLYVGDYYLSCYMYKTKKENWEHGAQFLDNTLYVVAEYPFWCREKKFSFFPQNTGRDDSEFLDYPFDYPYDYACDLTVSYMDNDNYADSDFLMVIYGPCVSPGVTIGGHLYNVDTILYDGELLTIDSRKNTAIRTRYNGITVNEFNARNKDYNLFKKIPNENNVVNWNTSFGFDVTLFQERSEPKWTF